jgi:hypothetical protein
MLSEVARLDGVRAGPANGMVSFLSFEVFGLVLLLIATDLLDPFPVSFGVLYNVFQ